MKTLGIKFKNADKVTYTLVLRTLNTLAGVKFYDGYPTAAQFANTWKEYPCILVNADSTGFEFDACDTPSLNENASVSYFWETEKGKIFSWLEENKPDSTISVKLNDQYTATVTKDTVRVGCQTFSHEIIRKVVKAMDEINA